MSDAHPIERLKALMRRLRDPRSGCPWDRAQTFASIAPHTLEEAYEVVDAIEREAWDELAEELGDLLFQVVFYARLAEECGRFDFDAVVVALTDKLRRRHPHVFGDAAAGDSGALSEAWEERKAAERAARNPDDPSRLAGIALALPALSRAQKLQRRAARAGFDWPDVQAVVDQVDEELAELRQALASGEPARRVAHELGDLLFTCVNVARHLGVDAESALRHCNARFERRFRHMEAASGRALEELAADELEALWAAAKQALDER